MVLQRNPRSNEDQDESVSEEVTEELRQENAELRNQLQEGARALDDNVQKAQNYLTKSEQNERLQSLREKVLSMREAKANGWPHHLGSTSSEAQELELEISQKQLENLEENLEKMRDKVRHVTDLRDSFLVNLERMDNA